MDGLNGSFASLGRVEISGGSSISAADVEGDPAFVNGVSASLRGGQVDLLDSALDVAASSPLTPTATDWAERPAAPWSSAAMSCSSKDHRF